MPEGKFCGRYECDVLGQRREFATQKIQALRIRVCNQHSRPVDTRPAQYPVESTTYCLWRAIVIQEHIAA